MSSRLLRVCVSLVLLVAAMAAAPKGRAQTPPSDPPDYGEMADPAMPPEITPVEWYPEGFLAEVVFNDTPSGFKERTLVYVPADSLALGPRPALVVFHPFGKTHLDAYQNTSLIDECRERGWFCLAPLGGTKSNFASLESQSNVKLVLDCAYSVLGPWLDRRRIYGIGFSMGAGDAATYAARHLDPYSPIFAAVFLHTGNHDKQYVWQTEPGVRDILEFWFGDTPAQEPWAYERASTVRIAHPSGTLIAGNHQGRNLEHTAVHSFYALADPLLHLQTSALRLYQYLIGFAANSSGSVNSAPLTGLPTAHTWDSLDQNKACDWLAQFELSMPSAGRLVVDRLAQYWWFRVAPEAGGEFTHFDWTLDRAARSVSIVGSRNLQSIELPYSLVGFAPGPLSVATSSADGSADDFVLTGIMAPPSAVALGGAPAVQGVDFDYDALTTRLVLHSVGTPQDWLVTF